MPSIMGLLIHTKNAPCGLAFEKVLNYINERIVFRKCVKKRLFFVRKKLPFSIL